jgi:hypothetical protein
MDAPACALLESGERAGSTRASRDFAFMSTDREPSEAERQYAEVRMAHDGHADLLGAIRAYEQVIAAHPESHEARLAYTQIGNIMSLEVHLADGSLVPLSAVLAHRWSWPCPDAHQ